MEENVKNNLDMHDELNDSPENIADDTLEAGGQVKEKQEEINKLKEEIAELKDKYLRQAADFDNFRKRNAKERLELIQTAGSDVISSLLEVVDDFDRAEKQIQNMPGDTVAEGIILIINKLKNILQAKGLKAMETLGQEFNPDQHEAVTTLAVNKEEMKGKVVDEIEKGYYLNDKIIRFAKVVVGK
ncbi:MAG TPA: nucleotide exchange factor GrpE [Flavitalea sp.]|nr:nucleotide exchange factor GrpE [Flavitalea sp.]